MFEANSENNLLSQLDISSITKDEQPFGKCDDWNQQLAYQCIDQGIRATVVAEPHLGTKDTKGNSIQHHAIALINNKDNTWTAADVSVGQINPTKDLMWLNSDDLKELQQKVIQEIGGEWKVFQDQEKIEQEMTRWATVRAQQNMLKKNRNRN